MVVTGFFVLCNRQKKTHTSLSLFFASNSLDHHASTDKVVHEFTFNKMTKVHMMNNFEV